MGIRVQDAGVGFCHVLRVSARNTGRLCWLCGGSVSKGYIQYGMLCKVVR